MAFNSFWHMDFVFRKLTNFFNPKKLFVWQEPRDTIPYFGIVNHHYSEIIFKAVGFIYMGLILGMNIT